MTITTNMAWEDYREVPGVNYSTLKEIAHSPMHYKHRLCNPKKTKPLALGNAAHVAVLEPYRFLSAYAIWDRQTESGRASPRSGKAWDQFQIENASKAIITADEYQTSVGIANAIHANPDAMRYLSKGYPEVVMQWDFNGRPCKGRLDWLCKVDDKPVLVGLKTSRDCRHFQFGKQAAQLSYHLQWAWYFDGYVTIKGKIPRVVEIVVESGDVPAVAVYEITDDILDQGREEYMALLKILEDCERTDQWPGPYTGEQLLSLPSWAYNTSDDIGDLELETE